MAKQYTEPEENTGNDAAVGQDKDVLTDEQVIDRGHTKSGTAAAGNQPQQEYTPPPFSGQMHEDNQQASGGETSQGQQHEDDDYEEAPKGDVPPGTKQEQCEWMANKAMDGYGNLKTWIADQFLVISEKKLEKMIDRGEIDPELPVYLDYGTEDGQKLRVTGFQAVSHWNKQVKGKYGGVSNQVRGEAVPIITGMLMRTNVQMPPWMQLTIVLSIDMANHIKTITKITPFANQILEAFRESTQATRQGGATPMQPSPPSTPPQAEQPVSAEPQHTSPADTEVVIEPQTNNPTEFFDSIQKGRGNDTPLQPHVEHRQQPATSARLVKKRKPAKRKSVKKK